MHPFIVLKQLKDVRAFPTTKFLSRMPKMKKLTALTVTVCGLLTPLLAAAAPILDFTGPFAPGTWTTTVTGNLTGASGGSAVMTTTMLVLTGGNAVSPNPGSQAPACTGATYSVLGPCEIDVTTNTVGGVFNPFSFDWAYTTADSGGPPGDIFGIIINGIRTQLSDPGGPVSQSGHFVANPTTSFGWFVNCTDCIEGAATATVSHFVAGKIPEPATLLLFGTALAGMALRQRRKPA
jgi:hypothetical protein